MEVTGLFQEFKFLGGFTFISVSRVFHSFFQEVSREFEWFCHVLSGKFYGYFLNVLGKFVLRWE